MDMETRHGHGDKIWTRRHSHLRHGIKIIGNSEVLGKIERKTEAQAILPSSVYRFLVVQTEVCRLSVC
jgi:hypothetical protein